MPGAGADLLGRLADEDQRALPAGLQAGQHAGGADPAGHVHVVAAGVHDADLVAVLVARADLAGVGQAGLLDDRQGVHVGAHQHGRPVAVLEDADDAVAADVLRHLEADLLQLAGQAGGGSRLVERQLGVGVQVLVQRLQPVVLGRDTRLHVSRPFLALSLARPILAHRGRDGRQGEGQNRRRGADAASPPVRHSSIRSHVPGPESSLTYRRAVRRPEPSSQGNPSRSCLHEKILEFPLRITSGWIYWRK